MGEPMRPSVAVLIVEDEPLIRMGTVYLLRDADFEVYEAGSADAAIALCSNCTGKSVFSSQMSTCRARWMGSS
jgi:DNA-binding NarL/FixJ family response regulator